MNNSEQNNPDTHIQKIQEHNAAFTRLSGRRRTFAVLTYGCQMNAHDSEKLEGMLLAMGYDKSPDVYAADLVLHNTCCIRENAENKVYGSLGQLKNLKKTRPELTVVLCGCMMQQDAVIATIKKTYPADVIFGTFNLHRFPQLLSAHLETGDRIIDVWEEHAETAEDLPVSREFRHKAAINIMYGCNNFCSYCIVPYVRGRERSRAAVEILREAEALVADGVKEILLLGQNVNSYSYGFAELLHELNGLPGLARIRFMTSHPKDLSDKLILTIADCDKVCKHVHLPLQSGSTRVLQMMNRGYSKKGYLALVERIRSGIPGVSLTTDIIVGFPGETEDDFQETLDVVHRSNFTTAFTFIYSKRAGTPAAGMSECEPAVVKDRFARLLEVLNPRIHEISRSHLGKHLTVLADEPSKQNPAFLTGRTDGNLPVHFQADSSHIGELIPLEIIECKTFYMVGRELCQS